VVAVAVGVRLGVAVGWPVEPALPVGGGVNVGDRVRLAVGRAAEVEEGAVELGKDVPRGVGMALGPAAVVAFGVKVILGTLAVVAESIGLLDVAGSEAVGVDVGSLSLGGEIGVLAGS